MREDELATAVVDHYAAAHDDPEVRLEEPYDAEGRRGVVDAYVRLRTPERVDHVIELKGDAAVRRATGANEVLRQYRRMERYFHADERHAIRPKLGRTEPGARYLLCFAPTPTCVHHVATHRSLYGSVDVAARVDDVPAVRTVAFLTGLDGDPADLGMVSVNGDVPFGSAAFLDAVPRDSRLAESLRGVDDDLVESP
ncbi:MULTISPECIES: hypothetical protein [unclassified Halorubrum]|uniref:hypothetical protein n=1 Tax=unclassified Halorubrum TaxID=2642239 RepID=UPI000B988E4A|nr:MULTISPECIES: hypothetical protein [unclassified Halorubrum]OYR44711.1 hypothetical protein DJ81_06795 [Halorubrum sp. Hd13]OYR46565.1 hypothetical protein DJ74_14875 [Halorubrum sp. Ea8]